MNTTYENFLFPLPAEIVFETRLVSEGPGVVQVNATIKILQAGRSCATTAVAFSAFETEVIGDKEVRRAERALTAELGRHELAHA